MLAAQPRQDPKQLPGGGARNEARPPVERVRVCVCVCERERESLSDCGEKEREGAGTQTCADTVTSFHTEPTSCMKSPFLRLI